MTLRSTPPIRTVLTVAGLGWGLALALMLTPLPSRAQTQPLLTGTVIENSTNRPLNGAEVILRATESPDVIARTKTDRDGTFQLPDLPRGKYVLEVQLLGYEAHQRTLTLELGDARDLTVKLPRNRSGLESVVLSPSRRSQKARDVAASVSVVPPEVIRREGASSAVEAVRPSLGVHVAQTGVDRRMLSLRGFGDPFSGTPKVLVDGRPGAMPLLGANAFGPMPIMPHDLSRIEVVRGPASSIYGPEASGGVVHFFSRDPMQEPGTSVSISGGSQSFFDSQFRQAGVIDGTVGYKFTGQFSRATDWSLDPNDPNDVRELSRYRRYGPFEEIPAGRPTVNRQLRRNDQYSTFNTNGLLRYRFNGETSLSLRGGYASLTSPLQTGIGTVQADELSYSYSQLQFETGRLSASVGLNRNLPIGEAYLLRTGETVLDEGTQWTGQAHYEFVLDDVHTNVLFGGDLDVTRPETGRRTLARLEGDEGIGRYGTYLESTTELASPLSLVLGSRLDYNDVAEEASVAPRGALIVDLTADHTVRAGYTRSVSYPGTDPLFTAAEFGVDPTVRTTTHTFEAGYKGSLSDRVHVHLDGYIETKHDVLTSDRRGGRLTYEVVDRIRYGGLDASVAIDATDLTTAFANASLVSDNQFSRDITSGSVVALNAPAFTAKAGVDYGLPAGFSVDVTGQYVESFPVRWGPYVGSVDAYTLLDVRAGYRVPSIQGLRVDLTIKNVLGTEHREFVGAPEIGRLILGRVTYELR